jgi:hypothetical protein
MEGADQIGLAVVATTFAIVAVFLPVGFMPGIPASSSGVRPHRLGGGAVLPGGGAAADAADGGLFPQAQAGPRAAAAAEGSTPRSAGLGAGPPDHRGGHRRADLRRLDVWSSPLP